MNKFKLLIAQFRFNHNKDWYKALSLLKPEQQFIFLKNNKDLINTIDSSKNLPIHTISCDFPHLFLPAISFGANINQVDPHVEKTPLSIFVDYHIRNKSKLLPDKELCGVDLFIKNGADINAKDKNGQSVLMNAVVAYQYNKDANEETNYKMLFNLLEHMPKLKIYNLGHQNVFDLAYTYYDYEILNILDNYQNSKKSIIEMSLINKALPIKNIYETKRTTKL